MDNKLAIRFLYWTIFLGNIVCPCSSVQTTRISPSVGQLLEVENGQCRQREICTSNREESVILIVGTEWWLRSGDLLWNIIQKELSTLLVNTGHSVYITVFDPLPDEIEDANNHNVRLIIAEKSSKDLSYKDRLLRHRHFFPTIKEFRNISVIIGYANIEHLADAARSMQDCLLNNASFVPILTYIPEDTDMDYLEVDEHESDILEYAEKAKFIVSLGEKVHAHFENKFRAIISPDHLQFFPGVDDPIFGINISFPSFKGAIEILTFDFSSKNVEECTKNLEVAALTMGKIANDFANVKKFKWKIRGLSSNIAASCRENLKKIAGSPYLSIHPYPLPDNILQKIRVDFRQCHLHIFAPVQDPFGVITLISSAAGVPTLCTEHTAFSAFLRKNMKGHYNEMIVGKYGIEEEKSKIADVWKEKVADILADGDRYKYFFRNAKTLQRELHKSITEGFIAGSREKLLDRFNREVNEKLKEHSESEECRSSNKEEKSNTCKASKSMTAVPICIEMDGSIQIDVSPGSKMPDKTEAENRMLRQIESCNKMPSFTACLNRIGIKCLQVSHHSLSIIALCPTVESLEILWVMYKNNSLARLITSDLWTNEKLKKMNVTEAKFTITIERWRYRRCKLELTLSGRDHAGYIIAICIMCGIMCLFLLRKPMTGISTSVRKAVKQSQ